MIKSFDCKNTEQLFDRLPVKGFFAIQKVALRKLNMIDAATILADLRIPPGNRLEKLQGKRKTEHSVRINKQWRVTFVWRQSNAYKVKIENHYQ